MQKKPQADAEFSMEHQAFAKMLSDRTLMLSDSCVLFKLFDLDIPFSSPTELIMVHEGIKYLRIECLRNFVTTDSIYLNLLQ